MSERTRSPGRTLRFALDDQDAGRIYGALAILGIIFALAVFFPLHRTGATTAADAAAVKPASPKEAFLLGRPMDINRASAEELQLIPSVGPKLAQRIVEHRAAAGRFESLSGLEEVRGIGPALAKRIADYAEVR